MRILISLLIISTPLFCWSQSTYTPQILQEFTNLYLDAKSIDKTVEIDMRDLLEKHNIDAKRYRSIVHLSLVDEMPELSANEISFIEELKEIQKDEKLREEQELKAFCERSNFDFDTYQELEQRYKTDIKFQRSLQSYFNNSLQRN